MTIKIIVADAHPFFVQGVSENLAEHEDCQVIGQATNFEDMVTLTKGLKPDVLLMGINLSDPFDSDGLNFIKDEEISTEIIVLSALDEPGMVMELVKAGIRGFVMKDDTPDKLIEAILSVRIGQVWLSPAVTKIVTGSLNQNETPQPQYELDERERMILTLLSRGCENKCIAKELHLAERTIRYHIEQIVGKLGAHNRTEAVAKALHLGLIRFKDG